MTEHLQRKMAHVRAVTEDNGTHSVTLHLVSPGLVDDYGTMWMADAFDQDLSERLPAMTWAHNWSEPIGRGVDYRTSDQGPDVIFEFDDFDAVPTAKRAFAQVQSGTITDCSVGFFYLERRDPTQAEEKQYPGIREVVVRAGLDEVALVLRGAVPKSKVLSLRSAGGLVDDDVFTKIVKAVAAGEMTEDEGKAALRLAADDDASSGTEGQALPDPVAAAEAAAAEQAVLDAEVQAALDAIEGQGL
jgi:HK97 family phage prohead protease